MREPPQRHVLLSGVVGSVAYGLAGPESDVDRLGVFAWPTAALFGLHTPNESIVTTKPDVTYHEAAKACRLMLSGNPTATEILWLEAWEVETPLGGELVGIRSAFLSAKRTRDAYLGYAAQQFRKLLIRDGTSFSSDIPNRRIAKHARHLARLCHQGLELYTTGHLRIRLENPQWYLDFGEQVARGPQSVIPFMAAAEHRFNDATTVLPDEPQVDVVEGWLRRVRRTYYEDSAGCA